ncbi:MAG TPA: alpha/beta hydrolase, partial [Bacteroidia bacterium]|nr:alpha/beta hydrolase [Bacteroidia bacterium]
FFQEKLIFFPQKLPYDYRYNISPEDKEVFIKVSDGDTINGILYTRPGNKNVFLYFHGNAGALDSWQELSSELLPLNCNLLIIDYRGYGKSTGVFSEKGFYLDAEAAYNYLLANGYTADKIIPFGRSLGTGVAVNLALEKPVKALILESPYMSITKLANQQFPYLFPWLLLKYTFDSYGKLSTEKLDVSVLIIHGDNDELIPCEHAKELYAAIKEDKKKLILIHGGGHNNLSSFPEHNKAIGEFLSTL